MRILLSRYFVWLTGLVTARIVLGNDPLVCSSTANATCFVGTDQVWRSQDKVVITPNTIESSSSSSIGVIRHLDIQSTLVCENPLCTIEIRDFDTIQVHGRVGGSIVRIASIAQEILIATTGVITTTGRGHGDFQGPGLAYYSNSAYCSKRAWVLSGASHGGQGGGFCAGSGPVTPAVYGDAMDATTMGSGGGMPCDDALSSPGGGMVDLRAGRQIVLAGVLESDAHPSCAGCAGGSGGSVRIMAPTVVGALSGRVTARGGSSTLRDGAGGGGGRILVLADHFSNQDRMMISAAGGDIPEDDPCTAAFGKDGTVVVQCYTSFCSNGGTPKTGGTCGCECAAPWDGTACTVCTQTCRNGGILVPSTCTCDCPNEWTGIDCLACNPDFLCSGHGRCSQGNSDFSCSCDTNWFGDKCSTFCDRVVTCNSNGFCSADGLDCECNEGKSGADCFCDTVDCSSPNVCENGQCRDGECFCGIGFVGCNCDIECSNDVTCSGHGQCQRDGSCLCDEGFVGTNCVQDPSTYCANGETVSGFPCVPGILNVLGRGYDAVTGSTTSPIVVLNFSEGRTFTVKQGETYEMPDGVSCAPLSDTRSSFATSAYKNTLTYRMYLSTHAGLSGNFKGAFLSASSTYTSALERGFLQEKRLYVSDLEHGLFECQIIDSLDPSLTRESVEAAAGFSGDRRVQALGTHYIKSAQFGGRISVFNFVQQCVFSSLSEQEVSFEVEASAFNLAGAPSAEGGVESFSSTECSIYSRNAVFSKTVTGGDRSRLIVPDGADSVEDLRDWFDSLSVDPGSVRLSLNDIHLLFDDMEDDVENYINDASVVELETETAEVSVECALQCPSPSKATQYPNLAGKFLPLLWFPLFYFA